MPHLNDIETVTLQDNRVSLLFGPDIHEAHVPSAVRRPPKYYLHQFTFQNLKGPYGILTALG